MAGERVIENLGPIGGHGFYLSLVSTNSLPKKYARSPNNYNSRADHLGGIHIVGKFSAQLEWNQDRGGRIY